MAQIAVLDQSTINKIAAGEVIERPASVVKELVENAIDAGSNAVTIEIKEGGCSFIRITDNGCGIPKDQIQIAFLRHSTSKIKSVEDLFCISSLGFRGEALSSIASVAQVELITKTADSLVGSRYLIDGGVEKSIEEIGCPDGTTFIIRNLFYNTPVRRKFLKSYSTEAGYISDLIEKLSLSHPEVSFRFINGGQNKLYTSGNGALKDVIYGVYGREITANIMPIEYECDLFSVTGFISKPMLCRGNRALENYYINGRYIKSSVISKAIEDAYAGFTMPKKYPFTSMHFKIDSEIIDINVHPTKMELRFSEPDRVYKEVYMAVYDCLSHRNVIPDVSLDKPKNTMISKEHVGTPVKESPSKFYKIPEPFEVNRQNNDSHKSITVSPAAPVISDTPVKPALSENKAVSTGFTKPIQVTEHNKEPEFVKAPESNKEPKSVKVPEHNKEPEPMKAPETNKEPEPVKVPEQLSLFKEDAKFLDEKNVINHRIIGQLFDTYWMVEFDNKLYIIDQHAAHEKVLYEKYLKRALEGSISTQQLLPPEVITLTLATGQVLMDNLDLINSMGFEIESFGGNEYTLRGVPLELYGLSGKDMILEILDDLMENGRGKTIESVKDRIATMACKAAVKGNNKLTYDEVKTLINNLLSLENPYNCPHGRPTMISMAKYELEKKFKRIV